MSRLTFSGIIYGSQYGQTTQEVTKLIVNDITQLIAAAIKKAQKKGDLPKFDLPEIVVERPKDPTHGDYATPVAMGLARYARMAPVKIAETIIRRMAEVDYISEASVAHPGFINIRLSEVWLAQQVETVLREGDDFGRINLGQARKIQVEYISSNPTGPLVVGSGRNAVLGDTLANVLEAAGYTVQREFYANDVGTQVDNMGKAMYVRYAQALGIDEAEPEGVSGILSGRNGASSGQRIW